MPSNGIHPPPSQEQITTQTDAAIALTLSLWPALTLAVQNQWGGPLSTEKRDWFAGAISTFLAETPPSVMDVSYLEEFLLNVMMDEFEVCVEDGSAEEVARGLLRVVGECKKGDFGGVEGLRGVWRERGGRAAALEGWIDGGEVVDEGDSGEEEEEEEEWNGCEDGEDTEMGEAPELVRREKPPVEVDEEGFTKVVGRRKR